MKQIEIYSISHLHKCILRVHINLHFKNLKKYLTVTLTNRSNDKGYWSVNVLFCSGSKTSNRAAAGSP